MCNHIHIQFKILCNQNSDILPLQIGLTTSWYIMRCISGDFWWFNFMTFGDMMIYGCLSWQKPGMNFHDMPRGHSHWFENAYARMDRVCFWQFLCQKGYGFQTCVPGMVFLVFVPVRVSRCRPSRGIPFPGEYPSPGWHVTRIFSERLPCNLPSSSMPKSYQGMDCHVSRLMTQGVQCLLILT